MSEQTESFNIEILESSRLPDLPVFWKSIPGIGLHEADDSPEGLRRFLDRNPGLSCAATVGDRLAGTLLCGHDGRRAMLYHVCVHPDYRNRGIGDAMVERTLRLLREAGINKCQLVCFRDNESGNAFWKKRDWVLREDLYLWQQPLT